jgi:hypothetical protein
LSVCLSFSLSPCLSFFCLSLSLSPCLCFCLSVYNNKTCCHNGVRFLSTLLIESQKYK